MKYVDLFHLKLISSEIYTARNLITGRLLNGWSTFDKDKVILKAVNQNWAKVKTNKVLEQKIRFVSFWQDNFFENASGIDHS